MLGLPELTRSIQGFQDCIFAPYYYKFGVGMRHDGLLTLAETLFSETRNGIVNRHTERIGGPPALSFCWWSCRLLCRPEWVAVTTRRSPFVTTSNPSSACCIPTGVDGSLFSKWVEDSFFGCDRTSAVYFVCDGCCIEIRSYHFFE